MYEAEVACKDECCQEQKVGYSRHAIILFLRISAEEKSLNSEGEYDTLFANTPRFILKVGKKRDRD